MLVEGLLASDEFLFYNPSVIFAKWQLPLHKGAFDLTIVFNFALCSIVLYFVIIFKYQITYKHKLISLVFEAF